MNKVQSCILMALLLLAVVAQTVPAEEFGGPEIEYSAPAAGVVFSHEAHVEGMGFECETCHDGLFDMEQGAALDRGDFTMASLADGMYCGGCHDGETAFSSDSNCDSCHGEGGGEILFLEPVKSVAFSHDFHSKEAGLECDSCHSGLFEMKAFAAQKRDDFTMASLYEGQYCGACHDGETAFASDTRCASCHGGVKAYNRVAVAAPERGDHH